jgi:hypothetical protein
VARGINARLVVLGNRGQDPSNVVRLTQEAPQSLVLDTDSLDEPVAFGTELRLHVMVSDRTPLGVHTITVRAEGPRGTEPQRAELVVDLTEPVAQRATPVPSPIESGPNTAKYQVASIVAASDVPEVGNKSRARWSVAFGCPDGRCDAEVRNGGPRGGLPTFVARYVAIDESFGFEVERQLPQGESCSSVTMAGRIVPTRWDEEGPVRFEYRLESVTDCARSSIRVVWEGTGRRL